jgi:uncharacterized protein YuzE
LEARVKVKYDPEVDILSSLLSEEHVEESDEAKPGIILDYDSAGNVVGVEILDASKRMLLEDLTYRQIFLDGRELPKDSNPAWMGYSVGHWEGDTLVVESTVTTSTRGSSRSIRTPRACESPSDSIAPILAI